MLNKIFILSSLLVLIFVYGCSPETIAFKKNVKRINELDEKFGATMKTAPNSEEGVSELFIQLTGFSAANEDLPDSIKSLLDFRIKNLEAELLHIEGWQWGRGSSIDYGFGCRKGSARILNSSKIRNSSAQKGFESTDTLKLFIDSFPKEAKYVNLSQKDVLFLNAAYFLIEAKASKDSRIIRNACKEQIKKLNITI